MNKRPNIHEENPYLKLMLYGAAGSTKTRTSATAAWDARTAPVLMIEMAGNPIALRDYDVCPDIVTAEVLEDFNPLYKWLSEGQPKDAPIVNTLDLHPPYKTVIVDGLTEVQRSAFGIVVGSKNIPPGSIPPVAQIQHFNSTLGMMVNFAKLFIKLPMHVIITSLEAEKEDKATGNLYYRPLLWGQAAGEVNGYCFMVARLVQRVRMDAKTLAIMDGPVNKEVVSVAILKPTGNLYAKDQYGTGLDYLVDPTIGAIMDKIERNKQT
jgi:hypothetical protein